MSLASPSTQSVQAFIFGLDDDCESHQVERATPSDLVEDIDLEGDEMRQSMYVELLDGTYTIPCYTVTRGSIDGLTQNC